MSKLIITKPGASPAYRHIDEARLNIGREEGCELRLDDPDVSKRHAVLYTLGNDDIIEDLGSTNGTLVNGQAIMRHILQDHDVIQVGSHRLEYINQRALKGMDFDKTMMADRSMLSAALAGSYASRDDAPQVEVTRQQRASCQPGGLLGMEGTMAGQRVDLDKLITPLGRTATLTPAAIVRRPQGYMLVRVAGRENVQVNGKSIGEAWQMLEDNDVIQLGNDRYSFYLK